MGRFQIKFPERGGGINGVLAVRDDANDDLLEGLPAFRPETANRFVRNRVRSSVNAGGFLRCRLRRNVMGGADELHPGVPFDCALGLHVIFDHGLGRQSR